MRKKTKMKKNSFKYNVKLVPLTVRNEQRETFKEKLNEIPYLLYEVEQIADGSKILINKPGGKRSFGKLARNDFMVFIYTPAEEELWLISHDEILEDLKLKYLTNKDESIKVIYGLLDVCKGNEPDSVINDRNLKDTTGISVEKLLKAYKWIWGQEDCNYYPKGKGRELSMDAILKTFNLK